jgi:hypothetical protein
VAMSRDWSAATSETGRRSQIPPVGSDVNRLVGMSEETSRRRLVGGDVRETGQRQRVRETSRRTGGLTHVAALWTGRRRCRD